MMTKYQVVLIGDKNVLINNILECLFLRIADLGLDKESILVIDEGSFYAEYKNNAPTFCLYFGNSGGDFKDLDILDILLKYAIFILPVVTYLTQFEKSIPESLRNINGFQLPSLKEVDKLVNCVLEGLSLLRLSRRLFISYKRDESTAVAIQLFEQLEKNGFDVFLDTHSIRPSDIFQEELWHRMADTDVVVLLNTPGFLKSNWTTQELAKANSMSIGILQLIWPTHKLELEAEISIPLQLADINFGNNIYNNSKSYLTNETVDIVVSQVESLRARTLASRQDNIITEFISSARKLGKKAYLQSEKYIIILNSSGEEFLVIPTVGVPQAFTYHQSEELVCRIKLNDVRDIYLLYDHRNIREKWLNHLEWLNSYLPIKSIKVVGVEQWLKKI